MRCGAYVLQQRVYHSRIRDVDHLKQRLIEEWRCFDQSSLTVACSTTRVCLCKRRPFWAQTVTDVFVYKLLRRLFHIGNFCRSYSDLNFGVTFLEHSVYWDSHSVMVSKGQLATSISLLLLLLLSCNDPVVSYRAFFVCEYCLATLTFQLLTSKLVHRLYVSKAAISHLWVFNTG